MESADELSQSEGVSREHLTLKYDGPALISHQFDLKQLGPALVGFYELLDEANKVVNGPNKKIKIVVNSFKPGSFDIDLEVATFWAKQVFGFLAGDYITGSLNLLEIIGLVRGKEESLVSLQRALKGNPPQKVENNGNGYITIHATNSEITVNNNVWDLHNNSKIRSSFGELVRPLEDQGIEKLETKIGNRICESITKEDLQSFNPPSVKSMVIETRRCRTVLGLKKTVMPITSPWKFAKGEHEFFAKIKDKTFIERVQREDISLADHLEVDLLEVDTDTGGIIQKTYEIEHVHDLLKGPRQIGMDAIL